MDAAAEDLPTPHYPEDPTPQYLVRSKTTTTTTLTACQKMPVSCACFLEKDAKFCETCPSLGGYECGPCDKFCAMKFAPMNVTVNVTVNLGAQR